ncbi:MAG TPA: hypothetical protein VKZ63_13505, partial [Kofleriaceae bacterium]|nr:hypothetical protein [Kofleriaceae bacterium]
MTRTVRTLFSIAVLAAALGLGAGPAAAGPADALFRDGLTLKEQGRNDEAIAKLEEAVAADPNHALA